MKSAAWKALTAMRIEISDRPAAAHSSITVGDLVTHPAAGTQFRSRITHNLYAKNLSRLPAQVDRATLEQPSADSLRAGAIETWLRSLPLARASRAKLRNLMSLLFNHGIRHGICGANPIQLVRQGAKRRNIPFVLTPEEIRKLIDTLPLREKTLVLIAAGTGLRVSELFALKWEDVHFDQAEISILRSIVCQVVGPCKTEASQRPIPMDHHLAEALNLWRRESRYRSPGDWIFASTQSRGRRPYWSQSLMRIIIRPAAVKLGISARIGWHTFRHTYSTLLHATGAEVKVMQELLRHASVRMTLETYTQAVTANKRKAQSDVIALLLEPGHKAG